jgi:serine protease Do
MQPIANTNTPGYPQSLLWITVGRAKPRLAWVPSLVLFALPWLATAQEVTQIEEATQLQERSAKPPVNELFSAAVSKGMAQTVKVYGATAGRIEGYSTGLLVSKDGLILTGSGVYLTGDRIRVAMNDGRQLEAKLLRQNRRLQLALLKIDAEVEHFFDLSHPPKIQRGDWVLTLSNAFKVAEGREPLSVGLGVISLQTSIEAMRNRRDVAYAGDLILIDAITSNPGAAGGSVLTPEGKLVGMIGRTIESDETSTRLNYAVPTLLLNTFVEGKLDDLATTAPTSDGTTKVQGELGIRLFKLDGRRAPAYIDRVSRGSAAFQAGLQPDDLILSIDGEKIANVGEYNAYQDKVLAGNETVIVVKRGGELIRVIVTPTEKK